MASSSDPNTAVHPSRGGPVPLGDFFVLDPRTLRRNPDAVEDLRSKVHRICIKGSRMVNRFLSILLGDDEALGVQLTYPTKTRLWLPRSLGNGGVPLSFATGEDFITRLKMVLYEVLKFDARATDVARGFARVEFYLVEHLLYNVGDLRVTLRAMAKDLETKRPVTPLWPDIVPSGLVPGASYILAPQLPGVRSNAGDHLLALRGKMYESEQFNVFLHILLGEDQPHGEGATDHDRGGALSGTDHDSLHPHGGEPVTPTTTLWLPEFLKRRDAIPDSEVGLCVKILVMPYKEVIKFGDRTTDVAKAFAKMEIDRAEYLLVHIEELRLTLQRFNTIAEELINKSMPDLETGPNTGIPLDALPEKPFPDIEPITMDDYIESLFYQIPTSEDE